MTAPAPRQATSAATDIRADRRSVTTGALAVTVMLALFLAGLSWNVWRLEKATTFADLQTAAEVQSRTLDTFFQHSQRSLQRLREGLFDADGHVLEAQDVRATLQGALDEEPDWATVNVVTLDGTILASTATGPNASRAVDSADRGFAISLTELEKGAAMSVGRGLHGPLTETWVAPLRYGVRDRAGRLVSLLVAAMPLERSLSVWEGVSFPTGGGVGIMRVDEAVYLIARHPLAPSLDRAEVYGKPRPGDFARLLLAGQVAGSGTYDGLAALPGIPVLWGYAWLRSYPLMFFIQAPKTLLWERWWASVWLTYLLSCLLLIGGYATYRWIIARHLAFYRGIAAAEAALRQSEARFRALIEHSSDMVTVVRPDGTISYRSPSSIEALGFAPEELIGRPLDERVHPEDRMALAEALHRLTNQPQSSAAGCTRFQHKDSSWRDIEWSARDATSVAGIEGIIINSRDFTARIQAQAALEEARRAADAASHAKSEFVARMSHELRTPLNAVIGFGELLSQDRVQTLTARQKEFSRHIVQAGRHLLSIVNDILDLGRSERDEIEPARDRVTVRDLLDYVVAMLRANAESANVALEIDVPAGLPDVQADDPRLRRVLMSLVSNAIRYNRPGGSAVLSAQSDRPGWVRLVVTDTGLGIAPLRQATLFEPFQHRGSAYAADAGVGIGLALSRRLVEAMGGSIGFTSQLGQGSMFWIDLPADAGGASASA